MSQPGKPDTTVPRSGQQGTGGAAEDHTERNLDEALEETFPASDPIAVEPDKDDSEGQGGRPRKGGQAGGPG